MDVHVAPAVAAASGAAGVYINAHTGDHPAGEIRGLIAVPAPSSLVLMVVGMIGAAGVALRRRIA